jgi:uncharacterized protein YfaP (DUF2135 family)
MFRISLLFFVLAGLFSQDSVSVFDQATMHEENLLRQMTAKESKLNFIDIRNHKKLVNGKLDIDNLSFEVKNGYAVIPEEKLKDKFSPITATFSGEGYISTQIQIYHVFGGVDNIIFYVLDNRYPSKVQIVLNWDNRSGKYDLDSHLKGDDFLVNYRNRSSYGQGGSKAWLNRDVIRGNAYEMITIDKPSSGEEYRFFVKKYRGPDNWAEKSVTVSVYTDNTLRSRYMLEAEFGDDISTWYVFKLASTGELVSINLTK